MYACLIKEPERDLVVQLTQSAAIFHGYEFMQDTTKVFDAALIDVVIVNNKDGNSYQILPIKNGNETKK